MDRSTYPTHAQLLEQDAAAAADQRNVIRVLGSYRACLNGPYDQGRKLCPSPEACQISSEADPPRPPMRRGDMLRVLLFGLASWAAVALTLYAMGVRL